MATGNPKTRWKGHQLSPLTQGTATNDLDVYLSYQGKRSESEVLASDAAETRILWQPETEKIYSNRLYYGDNLPILAALLRDSSVRGKVRLIYIDPPFATKGVFQTRTQNDAYYDLLSGANYIEFLRERLVLLRELLAEDGSIYIHLDDNMAFYIKVIMDEVFGKGRFRNWITRKKCNPKNYTQKAYGNISDYILFYTKSDNYVWNRPYNEWTPEHAKKEYQYIEKETGRRYKKVPIHAPGVRNGETGKPWRGMNPPPGKHWQFQPRTLDEMNARGEIYWSPNGNPRRKVYLDKSEGIPVQDIWLEYRDAHNQNIKITGYPTEKNPDMISRIVSASSNQGDLVLDCFSGSGTTLAVASQSARKWIGIDSSPEAIAVTLQRFAKGRVRMGDFVSERASVAVQQQAYVNLPLFGPDELTEPVQHQEDSSIKDFDLLCTHSYQGELQGVLEQWQQYS